MKTNSTLALKIPNPTLEFLVFHLQNTRTSIAKHLQLDPCTLVGSIGNTTCHSYPPSICACSRKLICQTNQENLKSTNSSHISKCRQDNCKPNLFVSPTDWHGHSYVKLALALSRHSAVQLLCSFTDDRMVSWQWPWRPGRQVNSIL
jgi:hypothetical protein